jgi:Kef-type K+ transport system membrane component KefB
LLFLVLTPAVSAAVFRVESGQPIVVMGQVRLILLMCQPGPEFDFSLLTARHHRATVLTVPGVGRVLLFILGVSCAGVSAAAHVPGIDGTVDRQFLCTAFASTALPIRVRIMLECQMTRRALFVIAIGAAALNDVISSLLLAGVSLIAIADIDADGFGQ